jgi:hypothetical protein
MHSNALTFETLEIDTRETEAGISPQGVSAYLAGLFIPDGPAITALEIALNVSHGTLASDVERGL